MRLVAVRTCRVCTETRSRWASVATSAPDVLTFDAEATITTAPGNTPGPPAAGRARVGGATSAAIDLAALRGMRILNVSGAAGSKVGPDRVCYPRAIDDPRGDFAGVSMAMGGLTVTARQRPRR
jgi:hypothetical protein